MADTFQSVAGGAQRVFAVPPGGEGLRSFVTTFQTVEMSASVNSPLQTSDYKPLVAFAVGQQTVTVTTTNGGIVTCQPVTATDGVVVGLNTALSRASFWLDSIDDNGLLAFNEAVTPLHFQLRCAINPNGASETRWSGRVNLPDWKSRGGLIVQYGGLLATQFELWGAAELTELATTLTPKLRIIVALDRIGDVEQTITGQYVTTVP